MSPLVVDAAGIPGLPVYSSCFDTDNDPKWWLVGVSRVGLPYEDVTGPGDATSLALAGCALIS
jgi:hypothetical protein